MNETETKKLMTQARTGGMCLAGPGMRRAGIDACRHDAAIAHEQREIIRMLEYRLAETAAIHSSNMLPSEEKTIADVLAKAAPYLD